MNTARVCRLVFREGGWVVLECINPLISNTKFYNVGYQDDGEEFNPLTYESKVEQLPSLALAQKVAIELMLAFEEGVAWTAIHESNDAPELAYGGKVIHSLFQGFEIVAKRR